MWLSGRYDVPQESIDDPPSPVFRQFLLYWFGSNSISTIERVRVINELTPEELATAQELVRRNLKTKRNHLINATWLLRDTSAAPLLHTMLEEEPDESRRLTIAGALWKLVRDPTFIECLERAKETDIMSAHMEQVLWLDDERAIDFLIQLLPGESRRSNFGMARGHDLKDPGPRALGLLNRLESGMNAPFEKQNPPSYYRQIRQEPAFRERMLQAIHAENESKRFLLL